MSADNNGSSTKQSVWTDQIEVAAGHLYERVKQLLSDGSVRRLIVRRPNDAIILEVPLTAGAAGIGIGLLILPQILAIAAVAALFAKFKLEIVRVEAEAAEEDVQYIKVEQPEE